MKGAYVETLNAYHEDWLNDSIPWIWIKSLKHFVGAFPDIYARTGQGLKGPYQSDMYMQPNIPKP